MNFIQLHARPVAPEKPQFLKIRSLKGSVELRTEAEMETRTLKQSNDVLRRERWFMSPILGLGTSGSIYHPNLLIFDLDVDLGLDLQETTLTSTTPLPLSGGTRKETGLFQRYHANTTLLREKPYVTTLFADKGDTFREYDFFGRVEVDTRTYGGRTGYSGGPVPVSLSLARSEEATSSLLRPSTSAEDRLSFEASNDRGPGNRTDLTYSLDQFTRAETGVWGQGNFNQKGLSQMADLFDTEIFGPNDSFRLNSSAFYNRQEQNLLSNDSLSAQENLEAIHTDFLRGNYHYDYDQRDSGPVRSAGHRGRAQLRHELYASLSSSVETHGETSEDTNFNRNMYGAGFTENYRKRLADWGRLNLGYGFVLDQEQREAVARSLAVTDESHTLTDGVVALLGLPRVDLASVRVTDNTKVIVYRENLDYRLLPQGERVEIQRVFGGTIPNGGRVLVSYTASQQASDNFSTRNNQYQFRLDLYDGLLGVYARRNEVTHRGGASQMVQNIASDVLGLDSAWRWLRAGAEYENFRSNVGPYIALRLREGLTFEPTEASTLTFDLNQTQTTWREPTQKQQTYDVIGRYRVRLFPSLSWSAEGGYRVQQGRGVQQRMQTVRSDLDFRMGELHVSIGYTFEDEDFSGNLLERHFFFLQADRHF